MSPISSNQSEPESWHDYLSMVFYFVGSIIELHLAFVLIESWTVFGTLSPEVQAGTAWNLFLTFWSGITQFVIGWLVAHAKGDSLLEPEERQIRKEVRRESIRRMVRLALRIFALLLILYLIFLFIRFVSADIIQSIVTPCL